MNNFDYEFRNSPEKRQNHVKKTHSFWIVQFDSIENVHRSVSNRFTIESFRWCCSNVWVSDREIVCVKWLSVCVKWIVFFFHYFSQLKMRRRQNELLLRCALTDTHTATGDERTQILTTIHVSSCICITTFFSYNWVNSTSPFRCPLMISVNGFWWAIHCDLNDLRQRQIIQPPIITKVMQSKTITANHLNECVASIRKA